MLIVALDDEPLLLDALVHCVRAAQPDAQVRSFALASAVLREMEEGCLRPDAAFLDIEMPGLSGIELAKRIRELSPGTNIIFVTGYRQYAVEASEMYASGYVMKPVCVERVRAELRNLRHPVRRAPAKRMSIHCFGHFDVFVDGERVCFRHSKTKELFAYLVDRRGASLNTAEICAVLWEDCPDTASQRSQFRSFVSDLVRTLAELNVADVFLKRRNSFAINTSAVDCDMYRFLQKDIEAINTYNGEYMAQYSWAEMRLGGLTR